MNLDEHASDNTANPGQVSSGLSGSIQPKSSPPEEQKDLYEEVRGLRLELEQLREQTALQRTPRPTKRIRVMRKNKRIAQSRGTALLAPLIAAAHSD
jgi:hypothetical protein